MTWNELSQEEDLITIQEQSKVRPVVIFKHSTRCSISAVAKGRLERAGKPEGIDFYLLDLIRYRSVSNKIAELFNVYHESPQVLLIVNGDCIYDESHSGINMNELIEHSSQLNA